MKNWIMLCAIVQMVTVTVNAGAPVEATADLPSVANAATEAGGRLPWQDAQPFYWDRAAPLHAPVNEHLRDAPVRTEYPMPPKHKPARLVPVRVVHPQ